MKELILFYSLGGNTRRYAKARAADSGADIFEVTELRRRSKLGAWISGIAQSAGLKRVPINPVDVNFDEYDKVIVAAPVWAGAHAAPINAAIDLIPDGKTVEGVLVSGGGNAGDGKYPAVFAPKKFNVTEIVNVKASAGK
jgi:flavodoxin